MPQVDRPDRDGLLALGGLGSLAAASIPEIEVVGHVAGQEIISCPELYGGFCVRRHSSENPPYQVDDEVYRRPASARRVGAKVKVACSKARQKVRTGPGFTRLDHAFSAAADLYHMAEYPWLPRWRTQSLERWDPATSGLSTRELSAVVRQVACFLGASQAGIAPLDERWFFRAEMDRTITPQRVVEIRFSDEIDAPQVLEDGTKVAPRSMRSLVVMAFEMGAETMNLEVSATASGGTGDAYSRMWFTTTRLAEFLFGLGYGAIPIGNDVALSLPMAVDAGLGEVARSGMLVTPKYGPRVRLAKVLTDMPLALDVPISFGVREFCETCGLCARECPGGAISSGPRTDDRSPSGSPGVHRWAVDGEACKAVWAQLGVSCHNCIRVCPFSQPGERLIQITRDLVTKDDSP